MDEDDMTGCVHVTVAEPLEVQEGVMSMVKGPGEQTAEVTPPSPKKLASPPQFAKGCPFTK